MEHNHEGKVDLNSFKKVMTNLANIRAEVICKNVFNEFSKQFSGFINVDEYKRLNRVFKTAATDRELEREFSQLSRDREQLISKKGSMCSQLYLFRVS